MQWTDCIRWLIEKVVGEFARDGGRQTCGHILPAIESMNSLTQLLKAVTKMLAEKKARRSEPFCAADAMPVGRTPMP